MVHSLCCLMVSRLRSCLHLFVSRMPIWLSSSPSPSPRSRVWLRWLRFLSTHAVLVSKCMSLMTLIVIDVQVLSSCTTFEGIDALIAVCCVWSVPRMYEAFKSE
jgi:hypothetical protein